MAHIGKLRPGRAAEANSATSGCIRYWVSKRQGLPRLSIILVIQDAGFLGGGVCRTNIILLMAANPCAGWLLGSGFKEHL